MDINVFTLKEQNKIQISGRYLCKEGALFFDNVASGFEVTFYGTRLTATMRTVARPRINKAYAMFSVLCITVDGETDPLQKRLDVKSEEFSEYILAEDLPLGYHCVRVLKTDDPLISAWLVKSLAVDGDISTVSDCKRVKIEAFGDSIMSGGDNLIGDGESLDVVPGTGNGAATYVTYSASDIGAEVSVFSRCGLCLYGASSADTEIVVSKIYDRLSPLTLEKWDMSEYVPDIVVIGLGTNDELGNLFTVESFAEEYIRFLHRLGEIYGKDTLFVCTYGYMNKNDDVENAVKIVVERLIGQGFEVCALKLPQAKRGHPSITEHKKGAELLTELLRSKGF